MPDITNETTNAVLAEKINGLSKITDDRLLNIKETLARIEISNTRFSTKAEVEEVKKDFNRMVEEIKNEFIKHNLDDKESFETLKGGYAKTQGTIKYAMGAVMVIIAVLQFLIPIILHYLKLI